MTTNRKGASCGLDISNPTDLDSCITAATHSNYDFICAPIVHPRYRTEIDPEKVAFKRNSPLTRADVVLSGNDWGTYVVGRLDDESNGVDSRVPSIRKRSEIRLKEELRYASHLGLPAIMVKLRDGNCVNLARILSNTVAKDQGNQQVWVQVPMSVPNCNTYAKDPIPEQDSPWHWWNRFRLMGNMTSKLSLCLEIGETSPGEQEILRWMGEPIKTILLHTSTFLTNKKGYPVLCRTHQMLVKRFFKLDLQIIIKGPTRHGDISFYNQYLTHLFQQKEDNDPLCTFARGFEDFLQIPLQPLMDNLESSTYEVFERDPVKYAQYLVAIQRAITDLVPDEEKDTKVLTVMVVGAGRGPLVRASLTASKNSERKIRVFAVEKNPNAVVTLQHLKIEQWGDKVEVISCDMRDWNPPEEDYADILVSELLGSFADNELSPECLDGAQKFLKPNGISIPTSYTSFIGPIQSSKLFNEYRNSKDETKHPKAAFETPYVVHLLNRVELAKPQPLFTFDHPNKAKHIDNTRYEELNFTICCDSVLHGFGGYFECNLYKDVMISILPETHSPGMFSWFPIMFPIIQPVELKKGDNLKLHFWRLVSKHNVWYEWSLSEPFISPVHNPNGRSYQIGL